MKLKMAKTILIAGIVLMVGLYLVSALVQAEWLGWIGVVLGLAALGIWAIFGKCPRCGCMLGRHFGDYCCHCGRKFHWEEQAPRGKQDQKQDMEYYRFESGRYFRRDPNTGLFHLLEPDGRWISSGWIAGKFYETASEYERVSEQEALNAARAIVTD